MKNKIKTLLILIIGILTLTGCEDTSTTMIAYTSLYPVEYIMDTLYGDKIVVYSIYPDKQDNKNEEETNYKNYVLKEKQIEDFSKGDLYVYNGTILKEKDYAVKMINYNKNIKIIDASQGMNYKNDVSETWLDPSNTLMMASNIKKGLTEYVEEKVDLKDINNNYEELKFNLSEIDAELKQIATNSNNPTIVVSNDLFKYLEKYGFNVISLEENENLTDKEISEVKSLASNKTIKYIFLKDNENTNETIKKIVNDYKLTTVSLNTLSTISTNDRKDKKDYLSIMYDNINSIKLEVNN